MKELLLQDSLNKGSYPFLKEREQSLYKITLKKNSQNKHKWK